jgi:glycogen synthase
VLTSPGAGRRARLHVLRLCSVFEPEVDSVDEDAARFDPVGGMQNHTACLTRSLDAAGVRQTVVTGRLAARPGSARLGAFGAVRRVGVRLPRLRQLWGLCAVPFVLTAPRPVHLVHAHQGEDVATLLLALLARAVHRCPLVVTVHTSVGTVTGRSPRAWLLRTVGGAVERRAVGRADAVLALVPRTAAHLRAGGVPHDRVHVVPSGFEPSLFGGGHPDAFPGVPRPRVGYVGRLAAQKRPDLLVEAFARMRPSSALVLVGDGPLRARVRAAVDRSTGRERVTMTGFVPHRDVPAVLGSLDVLALPSAYEEMGSVLVEAMATGLPVVASRVGGIPDVVEDGVTGLLVPPGDVDALAAALDRLVADPALRERMCRAAKERAARYAWPDLAAQVRAVYEALLPRREPAPSR